MPPYSPLTAQLADRAGMIMSPAQLDKLGDKFATAPVCVGPFNYDSRVAGDSITVTKSPLYYDKNTSISTRSSSRSRTTPPPPPRSRPAISRPSTAPTRRSSQASRADKSLTIIKQTSLGYQGLTLNIGNKNGLLKGYSNVGTPIAANVDLRKAFEMAINRTR